MSDSNTVKFLGREYELTGIRHGGVRDAPICVPELFVGQSRYTAYTSGALCSLDLFAEGRNPQEAVTRLERKCFAEFRKIGKALGYDVER